MAFLPKPLATISTICALALSTTMAFADELTVYSFGGAYGDTIKKHMAEPFEKDSGNKILFGSYAGGLAQIKAQVESGQVQWDVINIEDIDLERACSEGLLEVIDHSTLADGVDGSKASEDFIAGALDSECAVPAVVWSVVFAYNTQTIGKNTPSTLSDIFDLQKFPGKRAFQRRPTNLMEWALIADGVDKDKVYEVLATDEGQKRAFAKLDSIKKEIVWFDAWSQAPQLLNDGGAVIVQSASGRFFNAMRQEKAPFVIVWDKHIYSFDLFAILKGSQKRDLAMDFVRYATSSKPLSGMPDIAYSPPRKSSMTQREMDQQTIDNLPTSHLDKGIKSSSNFWADYGETLDEKFTEWLLK